MCTGASQPSRIGPMVTPLPTATFNTLKRMLAASRFGQMSRFAEPLNLGSDEMVSINQLVAIVAKIAGKRVRLNHIDGPQGVRGRNSDNSLCRSVLGWEPPTTLAEGLTPTYRWIEQQVANARALAKAERTAARPHARAASVATA